MSALPRARTAARAPILGRALRQRLVLALVIWTVLSFGYLELTGAQDAAEAVRPAAAVDEPAPVPSSGGDYASVVREAMLRDATTGDGCR